MTYAQWEAKENKKNFIGFVILLFLTLVGVVGCSLEAHVESKPAGQPTAVMPAGPTTALQVVGKDDNCTLYHAAAETREIFFVNCKTGSTAIRNP